MRFEGVDHEFDIDPLEPFLFDDSVTEIMVNGMHGVYIERDGELILTDAKFDDEDHILRAINSITEPHHRYANEKSPLVDARLPDGSRINGTVRPISLTGPLLTIRKFPKQVLNWDDLLELETVSLEMVDFLRACVQAKLNIVIAGGAGSGKTTIVNALSEHIDPKERIITIETAAELRLQHAHVITLETRPNNERGEGEINMQDLIVNAPRLRPDRVIVGEVRTGEAWDIIQMMKIGIDGSMFTVHATSPQNALERVEFMSTMFGNTTPLLDVREQIASTVQLIIHCMRMPDGRRRIVNLTEMIGLRNNVIEMHDIYEFVQTDLHDGKIIGEFRATGYQPACLERMRNRGVALPTAFA
jgi:pilus assembly protein CpaF